MVYVKVIGAALCLGLMLAPPQAGASQSHGANCSDMEHQQEMNACFANLAGSSQRLLKQLMFEVRSHIDSSRYMRLIDNVKLFFKCRDAHCRWEESASDVGSIGPINCATCVDNLNWTYIGDLKFHLCEGEGMTGPCAQSDAYNRPEGDHAEKKVSSARQPNNRIERTREP